MPKSKFEFHVTFRRLLIGLIITIVPISLVSFYAISKSASSLERNIGSHFRTIAGLSAVQVNQFIGDTVREVFLMAADPLVVDELKSANRTWRGMSESAITDRIQGTEATWNEPAGEAAVRNVLAKRTSRTLRRYAELDPRFLRITVTDERGATIAATHKTIDYYQADEEYWQNIYAEGRGVISLTDILYDEATKNNYIGIGVPILDPDTNEFLGTLDALLEVSTLFPVLRQVQADSGLRAFLVKEDGTVITGPRTSLSANQKSEEYAAVIDALKTVEGRQTGYVVADIATQGETLIGFADTGLREDYRSLGWVVLVSQLTIEAFAPRATPQQFILLMTFIALGALIILAVYFSLHRKGEIEEIEEDFHPEYPPTAPSTDS